MHFVGIVSIEFFVNNVEGDMFIDFKGEDIFEVKINENSELSYDPDFGMSQY